MVSVPTRSTAQWFFLQTVEAERRDIPLQDLRGFLDRWANATTIGERTQVASDLAEWVKSHPSSRKVSSAHKEAE